MERAARAETKKEEKNTKTHQLQTEMASLCRNLTALLLFVLPLIHSHLFAHAATASTPTARRPIRILTIKAPVDDYDYNNEYDDSSFPKIVSSSLKTPVVFTERKPCQYNPCLENQKPCDELAAETGCLCPGKSGGDEPPHAPVIQTLLPITEGEDTGKIEVQWCAPSSVVSSYRVIVEGRDGPTLEFGGASRRGLVSALEIGTKVCVQAGNKAGYSSPSEFSCKRYDHTGSSDHKLLALVIGGGVGFILLLVIAALIICKCQRCKKEQRKGEA